MRVRTRNVTSEARCGLSERSFVIAATVVCALVAWSGCGGSSPTGPDDGGGAVGPPPPPGVYYVAINQPGASNESCDGSSPVDAGGGRCPFKDFRSARTAGLTNGASGVRVEVRSGTYTFSSAGLDISGTGEGVVVQAYAGEAPIFDGENKPRELVRVSGRNVTIRGITFRNGIAYNMELRGAQQVLIEQNRFLANRDSDSLKGDGGAADVVIRGNEFTQWQSQAIDMTAVTRWTIEDNTFHDPADQTGTALGAKFGSRDVTISRNRIVNTRGLGFGGVSSPHADAFEAFNVRADHNTFDNVIGFAAIFYSCNGCRFEFNEVNRAGGGLQLAGAATQGPSGCTGGCGRNRDITAVGNRFKVLVGGAEGSPNIFWAVDAQENAGLASSDNVYCLSASQPEKFFLAGTPLSFGAWVSAVGTDATSRLASSTDASCR